MDVLDDDDQRPVGSQRLEQAAESPVRLFRRRGRRRGGADRGGDSLGDKLGLLVPREQLLQAGLRFRAGDLADDLRQRPVGDPLAVGEAAADDHARPTARGGEQLTDEARLANPRLTDNGAQPARPLRGGALELVLKRRQLRAATDERRIGPPRVGGRAGDHVEQAPGGDGLRLSFQRERLDRFHADGVGDEDVRLGAEEDLARRGRLL